MRCEQFEEQRRDQRPVDDKPRIPLDLGHVGVVVVDAVAVEGERRITEQQHRIGRDLTAPDGVCGREFGRRRRRVWPCRPAVDDVVLFLDRQTLRPQNTVLHQHENEGAATTLFDRDVADFGFAPHLVAHLQGRDEFEPSARPHPTRQRHRRQETAALGMPVGSELACPCGRVEEHPMPAQRQRRAGPRRRGAIERRRHHRHAIGGDDVVQHLRASDPFLQAIEIGHANSFRIRSLCSPIAGTRPSVVRSPSTCAGGAGSCTSPCGVPTVMRRSCG